MIRRNALGYVLFTLYFCLGLIYLNHQSFVDEGMNLDLASCSARGLTLYKSTFHHHFPFAVYFGAVLTKAFGPSIPLVRLTILLSTAGTFLWLMRLTGWCFPIGFAAFLWGLIGPYYFSNMLLYDNTSMISCFAVGVVTLALHLRILQPSRSAQITIWAYGSVALFSNPLMLFPIGVILGSLVASRYIPRQFALQLIGMIAMLSGVYVVYLWQSGALPGFYSEVFVFNNTIYRRYADFDLGGTLLKQLFLLDLFNPDWLSSVNPLRLVETVGPPEQYFDRWIFGGLFYRVAILSFITYYGVRRRYFIAVFVYLFAAMLALRGDQAFHAGPFVGYSLFLTGMIISDLFEGRESWTAAAALAILGGSTVALGLSGGRYLVSHWGVTGLSKNFAFLFSRARVLQQVANGQADVRLGQYPSGMYLYYLTGLLPVSRYVYYYPWVVDYGRNELMNELQHGHQRVILSIDAGGSIWNHPNSEFLKSELGFAASHLIEETVDSSTLYVSRSLVTAEVAESRPLRMACVYRSGSWLTGNPTKSFRFGDGAGGIPIAGDWDGSGRTRPGLYRDGTWLLDGGGTSTVFYFGGLRGDVPVAGDWNGDGRTKIGIYRGGQWLLDSNGDGRWDTGDRDFHFGGLLDDIPVPGDWTGNGKTRAGIYRHGLWILDTNDNGRIDSIGSPQDTVFALGGLVGDVPVVGDWTGAGKAMAGIYRNGIWILDVDGKRTVKSLGPYLEKSFRFGGSPGDYPLVGHW